jgi:nucleotide-binding universal stress UspA family protein
MHKLFNNILVPVTLQHSIEAVKKAMQFSRQFNCDVHLLHISHSPFWRIKSAGKEAEKKLRLNELRDQYVPLLSKGCFLHTHIMEGNLEIALAQYAVLNRIDLILVHKRNTAFEGLLPGLNINRLAARTGSPVLSLQSDPSMAGIKNIVLPIGAHLPLRKIMLAIYMARDSSAAIHLISLTGSNAAMESKSHVYMEKAYQLLRENTSLAIKCKTVEGANIADTTLEYARRVEADLILVNPGDESLLSGPLNRLFSKFIFNRSSIPVITVA